MQSFQTIAVCIDDHPKTPVLLRAAQRKARDQGLGWVVLYSESAAYYELEEESKERIFRFLSLAEQMGAEVVHLQGSDAFHSVVKFIENQPADKKIQELIVGQIPDEGLLSHWRPQLSDRLARRLRRIVHVQAIPLSSSGQIMQWWNVDRYRLGKRGDIAVAVLAVLMALGAAFLLQILLKAPAFDIRIFDVPALFLIACMFVSARIGLAAGLIATALSTVCVLYFYMEPSHSFHLERFSDLINTLFFLGSATLICIFGSHAHASAEGAFRREKRTQALFKINRLTANAQSREEALGILHETLTDLLELEVAYFLPPALNPDAIAAAYPAGIELSTEAQENLRKCWKETSVTGAGVGQGRRNGWRFEPLVTPSGEIGVMGVQIAGLRTVDPSFGRLLGALADHSAAIIERVELARMMEARRIREEREKLRSMLLSSVSHDLKTPLASVIGSLSVYHSMRATLPEERKLMLTQTALDEAQRLDSFISNILDMTRLESGDITAKLEWAEPLDLVLRVKKRLRQRLQRHQIEIMPLNQRIEVEMDVMLTEQVLQNLLDNSAKYAPADSVVTISLHLEDGEFSYEIWDKGPGIPKGKEEAIFDKYSRLKMEDSQVAGTGLGLAISRFIMDTQKGAITVANHPEGGAVFTVSFRSIRIIDNEDAVIVA